MSRKDGKATLIGAIVKKEVYILEIGNLDQEQSKAVANACPVKIIKML